MNNPEKSGEVWDYEPEAIHSLGKCNRIPGCTSSGDFPQFVPAYTIHTATTQCGSGSYLVEALDESEQKLLKVRMNHQIKRDQVMSNMVNHQRSIK